MIVVVGGHSRSIGKTSVAAGIVAGLREWEWTAVKITQHGHGVCSPSGAPCDCATGMDHPYAVSAEICPGPDSDTSRFLAAGAARSYWVRTAAGELGHAMPTLRRLIAGSRNLIVESNSLLQYLQPDLYLVVADFSVADFKDSARRFLDRADALVISGGDITQPAWKGIAPRLWSTKPRLLVSPPTYASEELFQFVAARGGSAMCR